MLRDIPRQALSRRRFIDPEESLRSRWQGTAGSSRYRLALLRQPLIELLLRILGHADEAKTGAARIVHPGNLNFRFQGGGGPG